MKISMILFSIWQAFRANYTDEQIGSMVYWLEKKKAEISESTGKEFELNVDSLNESFFLF